MRAKESVVSCLQNPLALAMGELVSCHDVFGSFYKETLDVIGIGVKLSGIDALVFFFLANCTVAQ